MDWLSPLRSGRTPVIGHRSGQRSLALRLTMLTLTTMVPSPAATAGNLCLDPAVRHTNGIPFASAEHHRSNSVHWSCNPDDLGPCGDRYYVPMFDSLGWRKLCPRKQCTPRHPYTTYLGSCAPTSSWFPLSPMDTEPMWAPESSAAGIDSAASYGGIEPVGLETLGTLPTTLSPNGSLSSATGGQAPVGKDQQQQRPVLPALTLPFAR